MNEPHAEEEKEEAGKEPDKDEEFAEDDPDWVEATKLAMVANEMAKEEEQVSNLLESRFLADEADWNRLKLINRLARQTRPSRSRSPNR